MLYIYQVSMRWMEPWCYNERRRAYAPHSAIGAASGVTAPLEGRPTKDFSDWSCDTLDSSSVCDRCPRIPPGAFFVSGSSAGTLARTGVRGAAGAAGPFPAIRGGETIGPGADRCAVATNSVENWFVAQQTALAATAVK